MGGSIPEQAALTWVLTYALHSTVLLSAAWLLSRWLPGRALRLREAVWKTALLGGLATATLQVGLDVEPLAGRFALPDRPAATAPTTGAALEVPSAPAAPGGVALAARPALDVARSAASRTAATEGAVRGARGPARVVSPVPSTERTGVADGAAGPASRVASGPLDAAPSAAPELPLAWREWLLGLWLFGAALGLGLLAVAWTRLSDRLAGRRPLRSGALFDLLQELSARAGLRGVPRLCVSSRLASPATVGVLFPQLCVPERALHGLSHEHQEAMLAHELSHVARRDPAWSFLIRLVERALFFQPLNRVAARELRELAEYLADDGAVQLTGRELSLAGCLTEVAGWVLAEKPVPGLLPMAARGSQLGVRVRRLLDPERAREAAAASAGLRWLALPLLGAVALVLPGAATPRADGSTASSAPPERAPRHEPERGTSLADDVEAMLAELDREVSDLLREVEQLGTTIEASGLSQSFADPLVQLRGRVDRLRSGKERLEHLIPAVLDLADGEGDAPRGSTTEPDPAVEDIR